ncbi:MAG: hypothetical protein Q9163_004556 [Psora crenata]
MFAVPGWSVSASALKAQVESTDQKPSDKATHNGRNTGSESKRSRKRKRGPTTIEVTKENVGELWKKFVEMKSSTNDISKNCEGISKQTSEGPKETTTKKRNRKTRETAAENRYNREWLGQRSGEHDAMTMKAVSNAEAAPGSNGEEHFDTDQDRSETHFEQRKDKAEGKREKKARLQANGTLPPTRPRGSNDTVRNDYSTGTVDEATRNDSKMSNRSKAGPPVSNTSSAHQKSQETLATIGTNTAPQPSKQSTLTPLQQKMAQKLTAARFRHLNQTLYTSASADAKKLFSESPQAYESYHLGFRAQVASWPANPIEGFISDLKHRAALRVPTQKQLLKERRKETIALRQGKEYKKKAHLQDSTGSKIDVLPRGKDGVCRIIDLGCGDARLAASLLPPPPPPSPSAASQGNDNKLDLAIRSFDLAKGDAPHAGLVTVADITDLGRVGVGDASVDIAICCLSLMGTNWVDIVDECARVVREGGEVWVAEIKSRFGRASVKKREREKGTGKGRRKYADAARGDNENENEDDDDVLALEEELDTEVKGKMGAETDLSAFVEIFRKRGFVLREESDVGNKMFVKLKFVKSAVKAGTDKEADGGRRARAGGKRFLEKNMLDEGEELHEASVLKPCVYKTR